MGGPGHRLHIHQAGPGNHKGHILPARKQKSLLTPGAMAPVNVAVPGWGWISHPLLAGRGDTLHRFELQTGGPAEHGQAYTQDLALPPLPGGEGDGVG